MKEFWDMNKNTKCQTSKIISSENKKMEKKIGQLDDCL